MLKPKARVAQRRWETHSDEQLLGTEPVKHDPEGLSGLVKRLRDGQDGRLSL